MTEKRSETLLPAEIERNSFRIIREELREAGLQLPEREEPVILRCIHATADFDYVKNLRFSPDAVETAVGRLKNGCAIVTDTNMALAGFSRPALRRLNCEAQCFMADREIAERAGRESCTRAAAAMRYAAEHCPDAIRVVGNAPTALLEIAGQIEEGLRPALVVAVPVGFVNVTESKGRIVTACEQAGVPYIAAMGRKGGSTVAAAICNALLYLAADMQDPAERGWAG